MDDGPAAGDRALRAGFMAGAYLLGVSYGIHEVTNYLGARFCAPGGDPGLCRVVEFNDDDFSHWLFFAGLTVVAAVLMLTQVAHPAGRRMGAADLALVLVNAVVIGAGIFANLAFEEVGLDLYVVAAVAVLAVVLLRRHGPHPLLVYYAAAYLLGLGGTVVYRVATGA